MSTVPIRAVSVAAVNMIAIGSSGTVPERWVVLELIGPVLLFEPVLPLNREDFDFETSGTTYESLRVGLSHASKIIAKLVWVAELQGVEGTLAGDQKWTRWQELDKYCNDFES